MPLLKIEEAEGYMLACVHKIRAIPQWNEILSEGYFYIHIHKSVNLQYITLGCLDDGTNESSTKSLMFQVLFFYTFYRLRALKTLYFYNFIKK